MRAELECGAEFNTKMITCSKIFNLNNTVIWGKHDSSVVECSFLNRLAGWSITTTEWIAVALLEQERSP